MLSSSTLFHHPLVSDYIPMLDIIDHSFSPWMELKHHFSHAFIFYAMYIAYHLSELIEDHAYETYDGYTSKYADILKTKPVPAIATKYYVEDNPYMFDQFCTVKDKDDDGNFSARRPTLETLYDVFINVRDDEREHWKTLCNLVQFGDMQGVENKMVQSTKPKPKEMD
jgi:hypothetical protein